MADFIEGKRPVIEALRTHVPLKYILMADNLSQGDSLVRDIQRKAKNLDVPIKKVSKKKLDEVSERGSHQGVMAEAAPFNYVNMTTILDAAKQSAEEHDGRALIVVLDHITDAGNLGAIARSAECVGASGIVIPNKRAARVTAATYKSSAGAISHIPVTQVANLVSTIERLKDELLGGRRHRACLRPHLAVEPQGQDRARDGQRGRRRVAPCAGELRFRREATPGGGDFLVERGPGLHRLHVRVLRQNWE